MSWITAAAASRAFFDAAARGIAAAITRAIAPGSYVVISAGSGDEQTGGRLARKYQAATLYNHSRPRSGRFSTAWT